MSKQRWKDTLPVLGIRPSLLMASQHLVNAMTWSGLGRTAGDPVPPTAAGRRERAAAAAAFAAAHIRGYRKSLGVKTERDVATSPEGSDEQVLWQALTWVTWAARNRDRQREAAFCCRFAEADLRELWKRWQA